MTLAEHLERSVGDARVLAEIDIGSYNTQWVNIGAGIWWLNVDADYSAYVESSLTVYFSAQNFPSIGAAAINGISLTSVASLALLTDLEQSFYYDGGDNLYIRPTNSDNPMFSQILLGIIYGYSFNEFTPIGANRTYEGRLLSISPISKQRDPLYFGKLSHPTAGIVLINADGALDTFGQDNDVYGNEGRILLGYADLDYSDYLMLVKSYIGRLDISEDEMAVGIDDKRKQLSKPITYTCTDKNALDAIVEILETCYTNISYVPTFFNIEAWDAATAQVANVTITMQQPQPAIDVIQEICASVFGIFDVTSEGLYTFRIIDTSASATTTILAADIMNKFVLSYDPSEVISSIRVSYARQEDITVDDYKTWLTDTSMEDAVFLKYKTYNQKDFDTVLVDQTAAQTYASTLSAYVKDIHPTFAVTVPMKYYELEVGQVVDVEIERETTTMLGTKKCEVLGITYNLEAVPTMTLDLRIA